MKVLKDNGVDNNKIIIFTRDSGPRLIFGNHADPVAGSCEDKDATWDGGLKESAVICWPAVVPPGTVCNKFSRNLDILPTFAAIAGAPLLKNKIDGANISSLLKSDVTAESRENLLFYYGNNNMEAVRLGHWKLILPYHYSSS